MEAPVGLVAPSASEGNHQAPRRSKRDSFTKVSTGLDHLAEQEHPVVGAADLLLAYRVEGPNVAASKAVVGVLRCPLPSLAVAHAHATRACASLAAGQRLFLWTKTSCLCAARTAALVVLS